MLMLSLSKSAQSCTIISEQNHSKRLIAYVCFDSRLWIAVISIVSKQQNTGISFDHFITYFGLVPIHQWPNDPINRFGTNLRYSESNRRMIDSRVLFLKPILRNHQNSLNWIILHHSQGILWRWKIAFYPILGTSKLKKCQFANNIENLVCLCQFGIRFRECQARQWHTK